MNIETIRQAGISRSKSRWITNPPRRIAWYLIKHYISATVDSIHERLLDIENKNETLQGELETRATKVGHSVAAVEKDLIAISNRIASFEEQMAGMANLAQLVDIEDIIHRHCSFSQSGEDRIVSYIFERLNLPGDEIRYLDIGAAIPTDQNNTYLLYKNGGSGVLLEADPKYQKDYSKVRPRDQFENVAIVPERLSGPGSIDFYLAYDQGWSSVDVEHVKQAEKFGKGGIRETITVPSLTIGSALKKYFENQTLHLLSIDIEGIDNEVIREIDFHEFRPLVLMIEYPNKDTIDFLLDKGYKEYASTFINEIFLREDIFEKLKKAM